MTPHDTWANYYDKIYELTYGGVYSEFTKATLQEISEILQSGTVLDYGAGTGRLAIPLHNYGYDVIAVE